MDKKTVIIGASPNVDRYSYKATAMLNEYGYETVPVGIREGKIEDSDIIVGTPFIDDVHTVTLYVGAKRQPGYYNYILGLDPKRIIMNPGTENAELKTMAEQKGVEVLEACTLVMLRTGQF